MSILSCDFLLLLWALKNVAVPFDFGQLKCLLHFLCLVLLHAKQDGRNTERGREEKKEWNKKMAMKRIKDQQIPLYFQLSWPTCFVLKHSAGCQEAWGHRRRRYKSAPKGMVYRCRCNPRLSFIATAGPHICLHLCNAFTRLTSVATRLWVWRISYITTLPHSPNVGVCLMKKCCVVC